MFCEKCGNKLEASSAFCERCGTPVPKEYQTPVHTYPPIDSGEKTMTEVGKACSQCGTRNPAFVDICMKCGNVLSEPSAPHVLKKPTEPVKVGQGKFQKFGGLLLVIVCVACILCAAGIFFASKDLFTLGKGYHDFSKWMTKKEKAILISALAVDVLLVITYLLLILTHVRIISKKPKVFWSFHRLMFILLVLIGASTWFSRRWLSMSIHAGLAIAVIVVWTIYFIKSVRLRTYMDSDAYLRANPFTKNVASPKVTR